MAAYLHLMDNSRCVLKHLYILPYNYTYCILFLFFLNLGILQNKRKICGLTVYTEHGWWLNGHSYVPTKGLWD